MKMRNLLCLALCAAGMMQASEKKLMHCFAFTAIKDATPDDWKAFYAATDALPSKIDGISKVWYGKLASPLNLAMAAKVDPEMRKKLMGGETVPGDIAGVQRQYGVCMEMADEAVLKAYPSAPYHADWTKAYEKVRVAGTTTFNIVGQ